MKRQVGVRYADFPYGGRGGRDGARVVFAMMPAVKSLPERLVMLFCYPKSQIYLTPQEIQRIKERVESLRKGE